MDEIYDMTTSYDEEPVTNSQYSKQLRAVARKAKQQQVNRVISELEILLVIQEKEQQNYFRYSARIFNHYSNVKPLLTEQLMETTDMLKKLKKI